MSGGGWEPGGGPRRTEPGGLGGARSPEVPRFPVALLSLAREGRGHRGGRSGPTSPICGTWRGWGGPKVGGHGQVPWFSEPSCAAPGAPTHTGAGLVQRPRPLPQRGPGQMAPPSPALSRPAGAYPPHHCPCLSPSHTSPPRVRRQGAPAPAIPGRSRVPWGLMPLHHWEPCSPSPGWGPLQRSAGVGEMARAKSGHFLSKCFLLSSSS